MSPYLFYDNIVHLGLLKLEGWTGIKSDDRARLLVLAIAGQESGWSNRTQIGGPANGFWQFERGGGVNGVMTHPASSPAMQTVCDKLAVPFELDAIYMALITNDILACAAARLLLWTDPFPLPDVGQVNVAWKYYVRNWRPGLPHPENWGNLYETSRQVIGI